MARNKTEVTAEPGKQELFIVREFDAPRVLVFKAFIDPKLYVQWLGPRKYKMNLEKFEPRSGGMWRYTHTIEKGNTFEPNDTNHEVVPPERLLDTIEVEGLPEKVHVNERTARYEQQPGGRARQAIHSVSQ